MPELVSIVLVCRNVDAKDLGSATGISETGHPANLFLRRASRAMALKISLGYIHMIHSKATTSVLA